MEITDTPSGVFFDQACDLGGFVIDNDVFDPELGDDVFEVGHLMMFVLAAAVEHPEWALALTKNYRERFRKGLLPKVFDDRSGTYELARAVPVWNVSEVPA